MILSISSSSFLTAAAAAASSTSALLGFFESRSRSRWRSLDRDLDRLFLSLDLERLLRSLDLVLERLLSEKANRKNEIKHQKFHNNTSTL